MDPPKLTPEQSVLLRAETNFDQVVDMLRDNLLNLRRAETVIYRTSFQLNVCTRPDLKRLLEAVLKARCEMFVSEWLHRKRLLWLFSKADQDLRMVRDRLGSYNKEPGNDSHN